MSALALGPVIRATKASNRYCGPAVVSALTGAGPAGGPGVGVKYLQKTSQHPVDTESTILRG